MKKQVKLNEAQLRNMVAECVGKTLKEFTIPNEPVTDYQGNDLNYEHLFDEALKVLDEMNDGVTEIRWQDVAQRMGYHLDTLNAEDMELLHDAIEDAMAVPGIEEEPIQVNETKIAKIVAESVKRVMREEYDWNHYNDGPSQEEEAFQDELYSVIEGYGLNVARVYGNEEFIKLCVEIINDALNANKK